MGGGVAVHRGAAASERGVHGIYSIIAERITNDATRRAGICPSAVTDRNAPRRVIVPRTIDANRRPTEPPRQSVPSSGRQYPPPPPPPPPSFVDRRVSYSGWAMTISRAIHAPHSSFTSAGVVRPAQQCRPLAVAVTSTIVPTSPRTLSRRRRREINARNSLRSKRRRLARPFPSSSVFIA